jgi:hypothetical protein
MANIASPPVEVAPAAVTIAFAIHTGHIKRVRDYVRRAVGFTLIIRRTKSAVQDIVVQYSVNKRQQRHFA